MGQASGQPFRVFIHTGEVSGDLQGGLLTAALYRQAAQRGISLEVLGVGGAQMQAAGANILVDTVQLSAIGILEAVPYYLKGRKLQQQVNTYLLENPPDLVVLLDYMGPNVAVGKFVRKHLPQVPMAYYIAPQQWVFSTIGDTQKIIDISDKMLAIFPQEAAYFKRAGANTRWVGHPLVDIFAEPMTQAAARQALSLPDTGKVVTLLPASRQQELRYIMPAMFAAAAKIQAELPDTTFLVPVSVPDFEGEIAKAVETYGLNARLLDRADGRRAIAAADLVLNKSGTANLEVALMRVPQVVMYRLSLLTALVAKYVLRFADRFVSPVNLMENKLIVPELLQWDATPEKISKAGLTLLTDEAKRLEMLAGYEQMRRAMGEVGVCDRAANELLDMLPILAIA